VDYEVTNDGGSPDDYWMQLFQSLDGVTWSAPTAVGQFSSGSSAGALPAADGTFFRTLGTQNEDGTGCASAYGTTLHAV